MTLTYKSATSGKYELHALILLATETHANVRLGLNFFQQGLPYTQSQNGGRFFFLMDKDFDYITIFKEVINCAVYKVKLGKVPKTSSECFFGTFPCCQMFANKIISGFLLNCFSSFDQTAILIERLVNVSGYFN